MGPGAIGSGAGGWSEEEVRKVRDAYMKEKRNSRLIQGGPYNSIS